MITKRDLALIPMEVARAATAPDIGEVDAWEQFAEHLSLDPPLLFRTSDS